MWTAGHKGRYVRLTRCCFGLPIRVTFGISEEPHFGYDRLVGLYVHSVSRLPLGLERDYLDYGWDEPLGACPAREFQTHGRLGREE